MDEYEGIEFNSDNMIYEEKISYSIFNIYLDQDIDEPDKYREVFNIFRNATESDLINLYINSVGGITATFVHFYNAMIQCKANIVGYLFMAYSSAAFIALTCDKLILMDHCSMLLHAPSTSMDGKVDDLKSHSDFFDVWSKEVMKTLVTGFLTEKEIDKVADNKELWFTKDQIQKRLENREKFLKGKK